MGYKIKVNKDSKPAKYFFGRKRGLSKKKAQLEAGYKSDKHGLRIEDTKQFQLMEKTYSDVLEEAISLADTAKIHARNINQEKDKGASNTAIRLKYEVSGVLNDKTGVDQAQQVNIIIAPKEKSPK